MARCCTVWAYIGDVLLIKRLIFQFIGFLLSWENGFASKCIVKISALIDCITDSTHVNNYMQLNKCTIQQYLQSPNPFF